jgi:hypothetical protein
MTLAVLEMLKSGDAEVECAVGHEAEVGIFDSWLRRRIADLRDVVVRVDE